MTGNPLAVIYKSLSVFGRLTGGAFADGVSRVAYSDADVAGRQSSEFGATRYAVLLPMLGRRHGGGLQG